MLKIHFCYYVFFMCLYCSEKCFVLRENFIWGILFSITFWNLTTVYHRLKNNRWPNSHFFNFFFLSFSYVECVMKRLIFWIECCEKSKYRNSFNSCKMWNATILNFRENDMDGNVFVWYWWQKKKWNTEKFVHILCEWIHRLYV